MERRPATPGDAAAQAECGVSQDFFVKGCDLKKCNDHINSANQEDPAERTPVCGKAPLPALDSIIETAIIDGMDTIELEYVPEGLEVTYVSGNLGVGQVITDRPSAMRIVDDLIARAQLEDKSRGLLTCSHVGNSYDIRVTEYQSFGESAFRLRLKKTVCHA